MSNPQTGKRSLGCDVYNPMIVRADQGVIDILGDVRVPPGIIVHGVCFRKEVGKPVVMLGAFDGERLSIETDEKREQIVAELMDVVAPLFKNAERVVARKQAA